MPSDQPPAHPSPTRQTPPEAPAWKFVYACVRGTAHVQAAWPCQDAAAVRELVHPALGSVLLLVVSDGAGSAAHSQEGSALVCAATLDWLESHLGLNPSLSEMEGFLLVLHLREQLAQRAGQLGVEVRDLACTLSAAVIAPDWAWYAQVGDGAVVVRGAGEDPAQAQVVFWPDNGEYANQTYFVTDAPDAFIRACWRSTSPGQVALLTDGLHNLALQLAARRPHMPFFEAMFATLEGEKALGAQAHAALGSALEAFLDSAAVNARTNDDKTLVLAARAAGARLSQRTGAR